MNRVVMVALISYLVGVVTLGWMIPRFLGRLATALIEQGRR